MTCHSIVYDDELRFIGSEGGTVGLTVEGHAPSAGGDGSRGESLICAAVSHAGTTLLRSLVMIAGVMPAYTVEEGFLTIRIPLGGLESVVRERVRILFESFLIGMLDLNEKHRGCIRIESDIDSPPGR